MNIYLIVILVILIGEYALSLVVENLNVRSASSSLPDEFVGFYDAEKYKASQNYLKDNTTYKLTKETFFTILILVFILAGGFNAVDQIVRFLRLGPIASGLTFAAILVLISQLLNIPFLAYHTFALEEKYGFNRTTVKTFILDIIKSLFLTALIGGIVFAAVLWFFGWSGKLAWVWCWLAVSVFQLFILFVAPVVIMPLFNKFTPLEEGVLKKAIEEYAASQNFKLKGIFTMDASRRSAKGNAFFMGFGKYRRIALFDTLIEKHTTEELVAVLAHEIGHYKKHHFIKNLVRSILTSGVMFFILSLFINNPGLFAAFRMDNLSIYASLFFFGFLYTPISMLFSIIDNILSRRYEYQADSYSISTYKRPEAFIRGLKKLSVGNLSNLTPHPLKIFLDYSHPPVLKRIEAIRSKRD